jgi:hypothetical protein
MKRVSDKINQHKIEGRLIPYLDNKPMLLELNGKFLMPLFSSKEKYDEAAKWTDFSSAQLKVINDSGQFIRSVQAAKSKIKFHVVVDPYVTPEGNTRFDLIPFEEGEENGY